MNVSKHGTINVGQVGQDALLGSTYSFVDWRPGYDARMIDVSLYCLRPFLVKTLDVLVAEFVAVGHFAPDEVAELICPVQE